MIAVEDARERQAERRLSVVQAATIAGCHIETIREALRAQELHGNQRVKGGTWRIRPACLEAWMDGDACEHQQARRPVSLASYRRAS